MVAKDPLVLFVNKKEEKHLPCDRFELWWAQYAGILDRESAAMTTRPNFRLAAPQNISGHQQRSDNARMPRLSYPKLHFFYIWDWQCAPAVVIRAKRRICGQPRTCDSRRQRAPLQVRQFAAQPRDGSLPRARPLWLIVPASKHSFLIHVHKQSLLLLIVHSNINIAKQQLDLICLGKRNLSILLSDALMRLMVSHSDSNWNIFFMMISISVWGFIYLWSLASVVSSYLSQ